MNAVAEQVKERHFRCPFCHKTHAARIKPRDPVGDWRERWWVGCRNCEDGGPEGQMYLHRLAAAVGCKPIDLLQRADVVMEDLLVSRRRSDSKARPLPPTAAFDRWNHALFDTQFSGDDAPWRWLTQERGISPIVLARQNVGLAMRGGRPVLTFPMYGLIHELVAYKVRRPGSGRQMRSVGGKGRVWPLYPWPAAVGKKPLLVCAGELDALCAISAGLDACSVTLGAGCWRERWTQLLLNRDVIVCFDNGEQKQAGQVWGELRRSGVKARNVHLYSLGLKKPDGDVSDYLLGGGSTAALLEGDQ